MQHPYFFKPQTQDVQIPVPSVKHAQDLRDALSKIEDLNKTFPSTFSFHVFIESTCSQKVQGKQQEKPETALFVAHSEIIKPECGNQGLQALNKLFI